MLNALVDFAAREGLSAEPGFKTKAIRWRLVFDPRGKFLYAESMTSGEGKQQKPREFDGCPDLSQGEMVSGPDGCRPFLVDGLDVVLQLGREKVDESKLEFFDAKHNYWVGLLGKAAEAVPELAGIAKNLADDEQLAAIREKLAAAPGSKAKPTELATIAISREVGGVPNLLVQSDEWHDWWRKYRASLAAAREAPKTPAKPRKAKVAKSGKSPNQDEPAVPVASGAVRDPSRMLCLLSGEWIAPQPTHPKINGLASVGGHSAGDALSSFDKEAFCSFGLEQGANAALSPQMAAVYAAALNKLLKDENRCVNLAGSKVVYWFDQAIPRELDPIQQVRLGAFDSGEPDEEASPTDVGQSERARLQAEYSVRKLHASLQSGERPDLAEASFFSLTLNGNAGRVVVRELIQGRFEKLVKNIVRWFDDLSIANRFNGEAIQSFKFNAVLAAPFRELKEAPAPTASLLWRAALGGGPIPTQVMAATLRRTTIDLIQGESPRHARYGLLKASINRLFYSSGVPGMTSELKPVVDDLQQHPAYICGRVMGVLARIQKKALPEVKAGVVERFYAAAMVTPGLVLGRLVRNAEVAHIPAIRKGSDSRSGGLAIYFQNLLAEAWNRLREKPPTSLTLEEQTLFAIGYYHQLSERKAKLADGTTIDVADGEAEIKE